MCWTRLVEAAEEARKAHDASCVVKLRELLNPVLDSVTVLSTSSLERPGNVRFYLEHRKAGKVVKSPVKHYKNHRCVLSEDIVKAVLTSNDHNFVIQ